MLLVIPVGADSLSSGLTKVYIFSMETIIQRVSNSQKLRWADNNAAPITPPVTPLTLIPEVTLDLSPFDKSTHALLLLVAYWRLRKYFSVVFYFLDERCVG